MTSIARMLGSAQRTETPITAATEAVITYSHPAPELATMPYRMRPRHARNASFAVGRIPLTTAA